MEVHPTLSEAQGITLCKKKAELQSVLKLIKTPWKQGKISAVSWEFIHRHHVTPREHLYVPKASSFPILSKCSEADKTQFGQFGRAVSMIYGKLKDIDVP